MEGAQPSRGAHGLLNLGPVAVMAMVAFGFACYSAGVWSARRDVFLDGSLLYLARFSQIALYFGVAYAFRDHLPTVRRLLGWNIAAFAGYLLLCGVLPFAGDSSAAGLLRIASGMLSGVANGGALLVGMHLFSTYSPNASAVAIAGSCLVAEVLFAGVDYLPLGWVPFVHVGLRALGLVCLVGGVAAKGASRQGTAAIQEHPLQYGIGRSATAQRRPFLFLLDGPDWAIQTLAAFLLPFTFGFMSQLVSTGGLSAGLHDEASEALAVVSLVLLVLWVVLRGKGDGYTGLYVTVIMLFATGMLVLPVLWALGSVWSGALLKVANTLYFAMLLAMLARKAFEDPRRTYLYLGVFMGLANVSYGRLLEPVIMGDASLSFGLLAVVAMVFLWLYVALGLALFVFQRYGWGGLRAGGGREGDSTGLQPVDPFVLGMEALVRECRLTPRESEVLTEVLHGYSMVNVGQNLGISPETVRTHLRKIYQKTGASNKQELIKKISAYGGKR